MVPMSVIPLGHKPVFAPNGVVVTSQPLAARPD